MKKIVQSLAFKLGFVIFGVASLSFSGLGLCCTQLFSRQIDEQLRVQTQIPGLLMNQLAMPYSTARDSKTLSRLVGEKVLYAAVTRTDNCIHYCTDPAGEGSFINCPLKLNYNDHSDTARFDFDSQNHHQMYCVVPLYADDKPLGALYLKIDTERSIMRKRAVTAVFFIGGLLCILLTTLAGALLIRRLTLPRITSSVRCLRQVSSGNFSARIQPADSLDELGMMERGINHMAQHLASQRQNEISLRTELAAAKEEIEKRYILLNTLFETVTDHIYYTDQNGRNLGANRACCKHHGRQPEQMIGKNDIDLYGGKTGRPIYELGVKAMQTRETMRQREVHMQPDGSSIYLESIKTPLIDHTGKVFGLAGISRDITHQVKTEKELIRAKKEAETANQAKSTFLAMMSHEIRTPLNAVLGHAQIIGHECRNCPFQKQAIPAIIKSGQHLLNLINDILEISRTENRAVKLLPSDFDFHELLDSLLVISGQCSNSTTSLRVFREMNLPRCIRADQTKIRQILINLVGNAIKFTNEGQISISAGLTSTDKNGKIQLQVDIQDTGCGIAPEDAELIFNPFEQASSRPDLCEGTGLGLPLGRRYARAMGGDVILLQSTLGHGSTFRFTFTALPTGGDPPVRHSTSPANLPESPEHCQKISTEDLRKVPEKTLDALRMAIRFGRIHQMRSAVNVIQAEHPLIAREFTRLIDCYDYEKLTRILNRKHGET